VERRKIFIRLLTFVGGLFFLLEFLIPGTGEEEKNALTRVYPFVMDFIVIVGTMAFLLGPINLVRSHLSKIMRKHPRAVESAVFLMFLAIGIASKMYEERGWMQHVHNVVFYGIMTAFVASSMGLLSFYLLSAAYRSFRFGNLESTVMMSSAVVVLLGLTPLGNWMTESLPTYLHLEEWTQWLLSVPNIAVQRAVMIGAVGGAFAAGLRHWLGIGGVLE
jgi:uncharacterized membrane protein